MSEPLLSFQQAAYRADADHDCALEQVHFDLHAGELALVRLPPRALRLPLADAAQGVLPAVAGQVLYEGRTWRDRSWRERIAARSTIGRVFEDTEWISNLDVDENVILETCHNSQQPEDEIVAEAIALAREFGHDDLPAVRHGKVPRLDLRAFAMVRAFLGAPRLLVLERPLRDCVWVHGEALHRCLEQARSRGTAVLWTTDSDVIWNEPAWEANLRMEVHPPRLEILENP